MPDWDAIVAEHGRQVWQTVYRLVGDHDDAADCFQETFLSVLAAARKQRVENWGGFLQQVATARALDRLRQRLRSSARLAPLADGEAVPCPDSGPAQNAASREARDRLLGALGGLPAKQAEAVCLHYLDQQSYQDVGRHLGIAPNAVGSLLHRARSRLRDVLGSVTTGHNR
jgi:RNA polymerase sigma-70 factor, ECF subfamily